LRSTPYLAPCNGGAEGRERHSVQVQRPPARAHPGRRGRRCRYGILLNPPHVPLCTDPTLTLTPDEASGNHVSVWLSDHYELTLGKEGAGICDQARPVGHARLSGSGSTGLAKDGVAFLQLEHIAKIKWQWDYTGSVGTTHEHVIRDSSYRPSLNSWSVATPGSCS